MSKYIYTRYTALHIHQVRNTKELVRLFRSMSLFTTCNLPVFCHPYQCNIKQESPAIADKPARRKSLPKLLQFDVPTTLSLTILAYLHAFNCYCVRNLRNPAKFTENSNLWSSRSSKVIDLGANRKPICDLLLVINSNFSRICYRFRDIYGLDRKLLILLTPPVFNAP